MMAQMAVRALGAARIFLLIRKGMTAPPGSTSTNLVVSASNLSSR